MDLSQIFRTVVEVVQAQRGGNLEDELVPIWERNFPHLTLSDRFVQQLGRRTRGYVNNPDNAAMDGTHRIDRMILDSAAQTVRYADDAHGMVPGLLIAANPLSFDGVTHFEIEIASAGHRGSIAVGLVPKDYCFGNQPGWRPGSIGYHADDGGVFIGIGRPAKIKETCGVRDRMGCGIELINGHQFVYFTKNGVSVAEQPFDIGTPLFPAVGLNSHGETVQLSDFNIWFFPNGDQPNQAVVNVPEEDLDVIVAPQTGHVDFYWRGGGYQDVLIPAGIPFTVDKSFFEIEIFAFGENEDVSIGLVPAVHSRGVLPGLLQRSCGFHVAKGQFFNGQPVPARSQLEKFAVGDKLGCGIENFGSGQEQIFFTKNGTEFFQERIILLEPVFPAVGLRSSGRTVSICIQDSDTWGIEARERKPTPSSDGAGSSSGSTSMLQECARQSAITCDVDSCTASLEAVPGSTMAGTLIAKTPFSKDMSYFEFEFCQGENVVVGVASRDYDVEELPGCSANSVAYHSDDGGIYQESGRTGVFVECCSPGDTLGCGILDIGTEGQEIYFTKNGIEVSKVSFCRPNTKLYPAIGMKCERESTRVFFLDLSLWVNLPEVSTDAPAACMALPPTAAKDLPLPEASMDAFQKELECAICRYTLKKPKLFPCQQHSFCFECLRQHSEGVAPRGIIKCPVCRFEARLPVRGVQDFMDTPLITRLVEIVGNAAK